jgi:hypothetical protein
MVASSLIKFLLTRISNPVDPQPTIDEAIDHDKNFKELISTFFLEFLELFLLYN